ncbi:MAG: undecaprenyl-diphosphatase UppP [Anaerolineaceae bacterium]
MTFIQSIILGIVQGLTEFLPISSSAHLVLVPYLLNWNLAPAEAFVFDVLVQLGTLVAVIVYFWKDLVTLFKAMVAGVKTHQPLQQADSRLGWLIVLATIPAGLAGLLLKDKVEAAFSNPVLTAVMLFVTAVLLTLSEVLSKKTRGSRDMQPKDALIIGLFQAVSIFPGISRSGSTISGSLLRGFKRQDAARVSFLMAVPIMSAAGLLAVIDLFSMPAPAGFLPVVIVGFLVAMVVGYLSIRWFMGFLKQNTLLPFAVYCGLLSVIVILVTYAR